MKHLSICAALALALLVGCSKKHAGDVVGPGRAAPGAGKVAPPKVNDPQIVCRAGDAGRTVYTVELGFPDGCGPLPTEPGGQARELEITIEGAPPTAYIVQPVDLTPRSVAFVAEGCGAAITYVGGIGTLELEVAPVELGDREIKGTGHWQPTDGVACDVALTGEYSDYGPPSDD